MLDPLRRRLQLRRVPDLKGGVWRDIDRVWRRYYETLIEATRTGAFDVVAHLDLPKKWGFRPAADLSELENEALAAIAAAGMAIEINTSGLDRYPVAEMFPSVSLLRRARALGISFTFGSDAHCAAEVGSHFEQALDSARAVGYESFLRLSDGNAVALPPGGQSRDGRWPGGEIRPSLYGRTGERAHSSSAVDPLPIHLR